MIKAVAHLFLAKVFSEISEISPDLNIILKRWNSMYFFIVKIYMRARALFNPVSFKHLCPSKLRT